MFLQQGEKVPADILLLDSQQIEHREAITYVDTRAIDGNPQCQKKKSCYLTQISSRNPLKLHWLNYQEIIDGKLTYEKPDGKLDSFTGYLKLSKDPKTEKLTSENLVLRESVIKTGWVYGLVVYAGMDCKIMQHRNDGPRKEKWITHSLDRLFLLCVMFNILLGTTFSLAYCICRDPTTTREVLSAIAYHFLLFSLLLPHLLYFGNAILLLHFSLYNKAEAEIIDYSNISALGSVDFAVIANNGVLNSGRILIDEIVTASSIYEIRTQKEGRKSSTHSSNKHRRRDGSGIRHDSSEIVRLSSQM